MNTTVELKTTGDTRFRRNPTNKDEGSEGTKTEVMSAAERMYSKHLCNVKKYQRNNPKKIKEKSKRYMEKLIRIYYNYTCIIT